jgi:hypothetical protein
MGRNFICFSAYYHIHFANFKAFTKITMEIIQTPLNKGQYFEEITQKTTLTLHHTAGAGIGGDLAHLFNANPTRVATQYGLTRKGEIEQLFPDKFWASAINAKNGMGKQMLGLEKQSIQIELYNWGALTLCKEIGTWHNWTAWKMQPNGNAAFFPTTRNQVQNVCVLETAFRGAYAFEAYTQVQIESLAQWITAKMQEHDIARAGLLAGNITAADFELNAEARNGKGGVWAHTNYRKDKSDICPQPALLEMLNSL